MIFLLETWGINLPLIKRLSVMIVHLLGTVDQGAFFLTCLDSERIVLLLRQTSLPTSVFSDVFV